MTNFKIAWTDATTATEIFKNVVQYALMHAKIAPMPGLTGSCTNKPIRGGYGISASRRSPLTSYGSISSSEGDWQVVFKTFYGREVTAEFRITADVPFVLGDDFPGKIWFIILRLYRSLQPWLDQTWRRGEIEFVKQR